MHRYTAYFLTFCGLAAVVTPTRADTTFVNFSDKPVYVAKSVYQPFAPTTPGGFASIDEEGWLYSGWWVVQPGTSLRLSSGVYCLEQGGKPLLFGGLQQEKGLVTPGRFENVFVSRKNSAKDVAELQRRGYRIAPFQRFGDARYDISGQTYRLAKQTLDFNFESRDVQIHNRDFRVPGHVVEFWYKDEHNLGNLPRVWSQHNTHVHLTVTTQGYQPYLGAARVKGYYHGKLDVHYLVRN